MAARARSGGLRSGERRNENGVIGRTEKELDEIDSQLVKLYEKRMEVCEAVGEYKVHAGRKVYDRQRENEKMADVVSKVDGEFNKKGVRELYR